MAAEDLLPRLHRAYTQAEMRGWDFSMLDGRLQAEDPPWDFEGDCLAALRRAGRAGRSGGPGRAADLGTGGGERVLRLLADLPAGERPELTATEGWAPNLPVAAENLATVGVPVVAYDAEQGDRLPFSSASLDLIMCRHEAVDFTEVARVLAPGGVFLDQQVDGRDAQELRDWFGGEPQYPHVRVDVDRQAAIDAGLVVDVAEEWSGVMEFADVEALVTYLGLVPWDVADFRVDDHADQLHHLAARVPIRVTQRRFRLSAHQPA
ncbi:methyltransferase domain-containing protein [Ruania zhangjianzhongii]|uniref:methyltransferase domain-containing protein n=1 Tax=Ruania zhangjianzhongii TaxID=2603206 RepID=UPI0011C78829|nr:methyltransferase domain-containing protein [Ruania zhangjianzhongii]